MKKTCLWLAALALPAAALRLYDLSRTDPVTGFFDGGAVSCVRQLLTVALFFAAALWLRGAALRRGVRAETPRFGGLSAALQLLAGLLVLADSALSLSAPFPEGKLRRAILYVKTALGVLAALRLVTLPFLRLPPERAALRALFDALPCFYFTALTLTRFFAAPVDLYDTATVAALFASSACAVAWLRALQLSVSGDEKEARALLSGALFALLVGFGFRLPTVWHYALAGDAAGIAGAAADAACAAAAFALSLSCLAAED